MSEASAESAETGRLLDAFAARSSLVDVAADDPADDGVPPDMRAGAVDREGWVAWKLLPSTVTEADIAALEHEFGVEFPRRFRAYLRARLHLFREARCRRHGQTIMLPAMPSWGPLDRLRDEMREWTPLRAAGFLPFAQWGDGWGPVCFDLRRPTPNGDCPVVWIDHEVLHEMGPELYADRAQVLPRVEELYGSFAELLEDAFARTV